MCPKQVHEGSSDLLYVQCGYDRLREPTNPKRGLGLVVVYRGSGAPRSRVYGGQFCAVDPRLQVRALGSHNYKPVSSKQSYISLGGQR